jgi:hypothetical protein
MFNWLKKKKVIGLPVKVTEVSIMVSKKISVNFQSCCISYSVKATLDENNLEYLKALDNLKNELVAKVKEALATKPADIVQVKTETIIPQDTEQTETKE